MSRKRSHNSEAPTNALSMRGEMGLDCHPRGRKPAQAAPLGPSPEAPPEALHATQPHGAGLGEQEVRRQGSPSQVFCGEPVRGTRGLLGGTMGSPQQEAPFMAFQLIQTAGGRGHTTHIRRTQELPGHQVSARCTTGRLCRQMCGGQQGGAFGAPVVLQCPPRQVWHQSGKLTPSANGGDSRWGRSGGAGGKDLHT